MTGLGIPGRFWIRRKAVSGFGYMGTAAGLCFGNRVGIQETSQPARPGLVPGGVRRIFQPGQFGFSLGSGQHKPLFRESQTSPAGFGPRRSPEDFSAPNNSDFLLAPDSTSPFPGVLNQPGRVWFPAESGGFFSPNNLDFLLVPDSTAPFPGVPNNGAAPLPPYRRSGTSKARRIPQKRGYRKPAFRRSRPQRPIKKSRSI